jgi:hypothetical protein
VNLEHVFAKATVQTMELGFPFKVTAGSHWLAGDPLVQLRPDLFTQDCRYGLSYSGDQPECLRLPPDADEPEPTGLPPRPRSRATASR